MKKIAVITGASSGMGKRFAETVDRYGTFDEVWVIARHEAQLEALRATVPFPVRVLALDLTDHHEPLVFFGAVACMGLGNGMLLPNANAGMMSVRPELAGTASGLGGAMSVAGGAGLAALSGAFLHEGATAAPLLVIMAGSAGGSVLAILWVLWRERQIIQGR